MSESSSGWQQFRPPKNPKRRVTTAFARLAVAHLASTSGDGAVATALAGSLFFTLPSGQARGKVFLYLFFTMAPFSIIAPLVGPLLDRIRGGRRVMVIISGVGRAVLCFFMLQHVKSLLFFPEAFGLLVLQKTYSVTKPALVPATVSSDDELVEANSKLSLLSGIGSLAGAAPGGLAYKIWGPEGALGVAMMLYLATAVLGTRLPKAQVASADPTKVERKELHSPSIFLGASAMGFLRGIVGFMTMFLAFAFRGKGHPIWQLAVVGGASVAGSWVGALIAPALRRRTREENIITAALVASTVAAVLASLGSGLSAAVILAATIGVSAAGAKLAFDSIVQRDAPDANRGRSFARFETRFQIMWVLGALIAIGLATTPPEVGYVTVLVVSAAALFTYVVGSIASDARRQAKPLTGVDAAAIEIDQRMSALAADARQRVRSAAGGVLHRRGRTDAPLPPPQGPPVWTGDEPPPADIAAGNAAPVVPVIAPSPHVTVPFEPSPITFDTEDRAKRPWPGTPSSTSSPPEYPEPEWKTEALPFPDPGPTEDGDEGER